MKLNRLAALLFLILSNFAHGELREGEYLLLQPDGNAGMNTVVQVHRVEVISKDNKKYLVIRYEGDANGLEPSQIAAELIENEEKKSFYALAPPHKYKADGKIYELENPNVFVGYIDDSGVIFCSWSGDNGSKTPRFDQYRLYPINLK